AGSGAHLPRMMGRDAPKTGRRFLWLAVTPAAVVIVAFALAFYFAEPAPPDTIVMGTGTMDSGYHMFGQRHKEILARYGVAVELRASAGSQENVNRLTDEESDLDVGFFQGGSGYAANAPNLVSLGAVYYEPLWVFYRGAEIRDLAGLKGKKLAVGLPQSGTHALALQLLAVNAVVLPPTELLPIGDREANDKLLRGEIGAVLMVAPPESPLVAQLMAAPGIRLLSLDLAEAYTRRFPFLTRLNLPRGVFDFINNVPAGDVTLVSPTANLLARRGLHPALAYLLMRAATEIHSGSALLNKAGEFPAPLDADFPMSDEAKRYYRSGPPFLQRYLPYWAAVLVDRLWITLLPLLAMMVPLMRLVPPAYRWRVRSRIYRRYAQLKEVELELEENPVPEKLKELLERLDQIERAVGRINTPLAYTDNLYMFRQHINLVRQRVAGKLGPENR
ncbi:MAG: TAXI family TRAP transporter solute-binding subunit, partial [Burkholderiales bacterium]